VHARPVPRDATRTVAEALREEKERLLSLPEHPFDANYVRAVTSGKSPYIRFDRNDYSIPHGLVRKPLTLVASDKTIRLLDGTKEVARHERCWDMRQQIEDPSHLEELAVAKRKAHEHRGRNRLVSSCRAAVGFLGEVACNGGHLGGTTSRLLRLLDQYGASDLDAAIAEAHQRGAFTAQSVAHILDQARRAKQQPVPLDVVLPADPRVRDLIVTPHTLDGYDRLAEDADGSFDIDTEDGHE
jgi:hypothetical protein